MILTAAALKGKVKRIANNDARRAEVLMRIFFMERLLERVSLSKYKDNFILKGGMLASSLIGVDMRTTMDMDTTVKALPLNEKDITDVISDICSVEIEDNVTFEIRYVEKIMDDFEYPGVRLHIQGHLDGIRQPIKIDVSTDDVITPSAIEYDYKLMFEDRTIRIMTYNVETLLAEKLQTILSRGIANTRLRDYYDVHMITINTDFSWETLSEAFNATCKKRESIFSKEIIQEELKRIDMDDKMKANWDLFRTKNSYAAEMEWMDVLRSIKDTLGKIEELALYRLKLEMEKGERAILEEGTISSDDLKRELKL